MNSAQLRHASTDYEALFEEMRSEPDFYPWSSEPETGEFVRALARMLGSRNALELGTYRGYITLQLIRAMQDSSGTVVTVDCIDHRSPVLRRFDSHYRFVSGDDRIVLPQLKESFDLVYVDTTHTYDHTVEELRLLQTHQPNATLLLHDPLAFPGVAHAMDHFSKDYRTLTLPTPMRERYGTVSGVAILIPGH